MELVNVIIICLLFIVIHIILWKLLKFVISKYRHRHRHRHTNDIEDKDDDYDSDDNNNDDEIREGFTPKIRETYRSYVRIIESSYNNKKNDLSYVINKFFRKLGLR